MAKVSEKLASIMFADDSNLFVYEKNLKEMEITINQELKKIVTWLKANKLSFNV